MEWPNLSLRATSAALGMVVFAIDGRSIAVIGIRAVVVGGPDDVDQHGENLNTAGIGNLRRT